MKTTISRQLTLMALMAIVMLAITGFIGKQVTSSLLSATDKSAALSLQLASTLESAADYTEKVTIPSIEAIALMRLSFLGLREATSSHTTTWFMEEKNSLGKH